MRDIRLIEDMDGRIYSRDEIQKIILEQRPPVLTLLHVQTVDGMKTIPISDIRDIKAWQRNKKGRITGALIGVPFDCVLIMLGIALSHLSYSMAP